MGRRSITGGVIPYGAGIQLTFHYRGKRLRPTLKIRPTAPNMRYAARLLDEIRQKIKHGTFSYEHYFPEARNAEGYVPAPQSFDALADRWLATLDVEHSTRVSYKASLDRYWRPRFGETIIDEIRHSEIKEVLAPLNAKTKNNTLIPMRGVLQMAVMDGLLEHDPTAKIKNAKVQKEPPDPLMLDEVEMILADMAEHKLDQVANYFETAFFTGMRPSEQIAVEWSDYARRDGLLRIHRTRVWGRDKPRTKTHQARDIELLERARQAIERQRATTLLANGALFWNPNTNRPWNDEQVQRRFWVASLRRCGLRHREQYQTRHTFATMCLMAGANPAWVARQMGHKSLKMFFEVYARWIDPADKGLEKARLDAATCKEHREARRRLKATSHMS